MTHISVSDSGSNVMINSVKSHTIISVYLMIFDTGKQLKVKAKIKGSVV